jgi:hypothetical protein
MCIPKKAIGLSITKDVGIQGGYIYRSSHAAKRIS